MSKKIKLLTIIGLILLGILGRTLPHMWNMTPIAAIALFSAVYLGKKYAFILPVIIMFLGDIFIGFYSLPLMLSVYGSFLLIGVIGLWVGKNKTTENILFGTIASSTLFFLITNYAVWQFSPWYPQTLSGLMESYTLAVPFFKHAILGDILYTGMLFGTYELVSYLASSTHKITLESTHNLPV